MKDRFDTVRNREYNKEKFAGKSSLYSTKFHVALQNMCNKYAIKNNYSEE